MILQLRSDLLWVLFGRVSTALIAIASLRIMTSLLDPKDFGIYALLVAFQGLGGLLFINPVGQHINRHTHTWWDEGSLLQRLQGYNKYLIAVSIGIALLVAIWWMEYPNTGGQLKHGLFAALAVSALIYLGTWSGTFVYILNMLGFRGVSAIWLLLASLVSLACSSVFTYAYHSGSSWILGQAVGMAVGAMGAGWTLRRYQTEKKSTQGSSNDLPRLLDRQTILTYCLPLAAATGLMWAQSTGYRFWVGSAWGPTELGMLAVGLSISAQVWAICETLVTQFLNPYFFRHMTGTDTAEQKSSLLSDMVNAVWPVYAVLASFNLVFSSSLLIILTNERYHAASTFVMLGVFIEFARCTANLWSYAAQIERRTAKYIIPYGIGALMVWLGIAGVSYLQGDILKMASVLVLSAIAMCLAMVFGMQRMISVKIDFQRWGGAIAVFVLCFALAIFTPLQMDGYLLNVIAMAVGAFVAGGILLFLLWNNPALKRLLEISLRKH